MKKNIARNGFSFGTLLTATILLLGCSTRSPATESALDVVLFGNKDSESAHDLAAKNSRVVEGKDNTPARQIMKSERGIVHRGVPSI